MPWLRELFGLEWVPEELSLRKLLISVLVEALENVSFSYPSDFFGLWTLLYFVANIGISDLPIF